MTIRLDANVILDKVPFLYYIIDLKTFKIIKSNDREVSEGKDTCYKIILNTQEPCELANGQCICKKLIEKNKKAEYVLQKLSDSGLTEYLQGNASLVDDDLAFVSYRTISQEALNYKELDINNKRLRKAEDLASFGYWELNLDTQRIIGSDGALKIYGLKSREITYSIIKSAALPEYRELLNERMTKLIQNGEPYNVDFKIKRLDDNSIRYIHSIAEYSEDKRTVFGVIHDNTDKAETQEALLKSEWNLKQLFMNMNSAFAYHKIITDENGEPVDYIVQNVNPKFEEITGIKAKDIINKRILEVAPETEDFWIKEFGQVALTGKSITLSNYSGVIDKFFEATAYSAEKNYFAVTFNDITARVNSEKALKESLLDLELAQRISKTGNWKYNPITKSVKWSDQMYSLFERDTVLGPMQLDDYRGTLEINDFSKFMNLHAEAFQKGVPFEVEFKHSFPVLRKKWLKNICIPEKIPGSDLYFLRGTVQDITESKNAELEINKSNLLLRKVIDNVHDAIYLKDTEYRKVLCNVEDAKRSGFEKPEDIIGKSDHDLYPREAADKYIEDDRNVIENGQTIFNKEEILPGINGNRIILTSKFPIWDDENKISGLVGIGRDVTEVKENSSLVDLLYQTVEQIPLAVTISDEKGIIEYVNRGFTEISGYSSEEAANQKAGMLRSGMFDKAYYKKLWDTIISGETWYGEFFNCKKDGGKFWASAVITPIFDSSGKIKHFVAVEEDITGKKQMIEDLKRAKKEAEESDRLKSLFLANMSHEIRTPLNGILGFSNIICSGDVNVDEMEVYGKIIENSGRRLLTVIDDIIDISKIQSNQLKIYNESFNINDLITELHLFYSTHNTELLQQLDLKHTQCTADIHALIYSDKDRVYQIFRNLIDNSFKFTSSGSIEFGFHSATEKELVLYVKDTGIGIEAEKGKVIFQSFRQANEGKARKYDGSGLGLAIVSGILEKMKGKIWLESVLGEGSVFYFSLPRNTENLSFSDNSVASMPKKKPLEQNSKRILLVEDDEISVEYTKIVVQSLGYKLIVFGQADKGIDYLAQQGADLVLMDVQLPEMNGFDATRLIKEQFPHIPVIIQTAYAMNTEMEDAYLAGCDEYLRKPLSSELLKEKIEKYLSN